MSLMGDVRDLKQLAKDLGYTTESLPTTYLVSLLELNTSQLPLGKGLKNSLTGSLQSRSVSTFKRGKSDSHQKHSFKFANLPPLSFPNVSQS